MASLLEAADRARTVPWSNEHRAASDDFARGIEQSGLSDDISRGFGSVESTLNGGLWSLEGAVVDGLESVRGSILGVALTIGVGLEELSSQLAQSNEILGNIEDALRAPLGTAARERFTRGHRAFERGWLPEAEEEFSAALDSDPFLAGAQLMQALTILRSPDRKPDAVRYLEKAFRYATPDDPQVASGAALLLARAQHDLGDRSSAIATLEAALAAYPGCAELGLLHAQMSGEHARLLAALELAPDLAPVALLTASAQFEHAASSSGADRIIRLASELESMIDSTWVESPNLHLHIQETSLPEASGSTRDLLRACLLIRDCEAFVSRAIAEGMNEVKVARDRAADQIRTLEHRRARLRSSPDENAVAAKVARFQRRVSRLEADLAGSTPANVVEARDELSQAEAEWHRISADAYAPVDAELAAARKLLAESDRTSLDIRRFVNHTRETLALFRGTDRVRPVSSGPES